MNENKTNAKGYTAPGCRIIGIGMHRSILQDSAHFHSSRSTQIFSTGEEEDLEG